jgi:hypothetical protein
MPFDTTKVRLPDNVVHLPPVTPERGGGGPQRIHIQIEIVDRRGTPPGTGKGHRFGTVVLVLFWLLLLAALAHAEEGGIRYEHWTDTNGWHGETRTQGRTTDWTAYGPRGEQKHCHRYYVGDTAYTTCR